MMKTSIVCMGRSTKYRVCQITLNNAYVFVNNETKLLLNKMPGNMLIM